MSIDFTGIKSLSIPEGVVIKVIRKSDGTVLWEKPSENITLGTLAVGDSVYMYVDGVSYEWIVVQQGNPDSSIYDNSCDGTWLLMKDIFQNATWDANSSLVFNESGVYGLLNDDILNMFDASVRSLIKTVKIPYATEISSSGNVATGTNGMTARLFLLSLTEYGYSKTSYTHTEGATLEYFSDAVATKRIADLNGTAAIHWTRSMDVRDEYICYVAANGSSSSARDTKSYGVRPAMVLPQNAIVKTGGLIDGELYTGNSPARLPSGYTEVEYIGLTGTQYINTGLKASNTTRIVLDFELTDTSVDNYIFGAYKLSGIAAVETYYLSWTINNNCYYMYTNGVGSGFTGFKGVAGLGRHLLDKKQNNTVLDKISISIPDSTFTTSYDMYLGTVNSSGTPRSTGMVGKIYSCQIYDNDVLIRDFIPCVDASGAVGLYDLINDVFYGNAGTGVFEAGSAISVENITINITQASTASDYCYLQIGDTKYTAVQDIAVPSGTKVTFRASSAIDLGGISVNEKLLYQTDLVTHEHVYMDATTNMSIAFEMTGKWNYIHITTNDGKQYAYDTSTSYIVPAKTMTINGTPYAFEEGMTWGDWVDSSYNTGYNGSLFTSITALGICCLTVENGCDMRYQVVYDDSVQSDSDVIVEGREYSFKITILGPA